MSIENRPYFGGEKAIWPIICGKTGKSVPWCVCCKSLDGECRPGFRLLLMDTFEAAMQYDFQRFLVLSGISLVAWGTYMGICTLSVFSQARATWRLNNSVRDDLYVTLVGKSYESYHAKPSGEYISWLTNDIKQMEHLGWDAFFNFVGPGFLR